MDCGHTAIGFLDSWKIIFLLVGMLLGVFIGVLALAIVAINKTSQLEDVGRKMHEVINRNTNP